MLKHRRSRLQPFSCHFYPLCPQSFHNQGTAQLLRVELLTGSFNPYLMEGFAQPVQLQDLVSHEFQAMRVGLQVEFGKTSSMDRPIVAIWQSLCRNPVALQKVVKQMGYTVRTGTLPRPERACRSVFVQN